MIRTTQKPGPPSSLQRSASSPQRRPDRLGSRRQQQERAIGEQLDQYPAGAQDQAQADLRIAHHPKDQLGDAVRDHRLDQDRVADLGHAERRGLDRSLVAQVQRHGTELALDLPEEGVSALADPERVAQIMRILLDNALRHTPEGTPVTVSAGRENGAAEFTVADSGPGMSQGADGRVFDRFWTGDATTGAGLGLAIAKELAEHMRGDISVSSQPGRTAFTLELPHEES